MNNPILISAVVTVELKRHLEQWAKEEDRSISATLRQILAQEARRRASQTAARQQVTYQTK